MSRTVITISSFFIADFSMSLYKYSINFQFSEKVCIFIALVYLLEGDGVNNSAYNVSYFSLHFASWRLVIHSVNERNILCEINDNIAI